MDLIKTTPVESIAFFISLIIIILSVSAYLIIDTSVRNQKLVVELTEYKLKAYKQETRLDKLQIILDQERDWHSEATSALKARVKYLDDKIKIYDDHIVEGYMLINQAVDYMQDHKTTVSNLNRNILGLKEWVERTSEVVRK